MELYLEVIEEINQVLLQQQHLTKGDSEEKQEKERKVSAIEEGTSQEDGWIAFLHKNMPFYTEKWLIVYENN